MDVTLEFLQERCKEFEENSLKKELIRGRKEIPLK